MLIDTLKAKRHLTDDLQIPENIADGIIETLTSAEENVTTKEDFEVLRSDFEVLRSDFASLEARIDKKLARWALTIVGLQTAIMALLLALFAFVT